MGCAQSLLGLVSGEVHIFSYNLMLAYQPWNSNRLQSLTSHLIWFLLGLLFHSGTHTNTHIQCIHTQVSSNFLIKYEEKEKQSSEWPDDLLFKCEVSYRQPVMVCRSQCQLISQSNVELPFSQNTSGNIETCHPRVHGPVYLVFLTSIQQYSLPVKSNTSNVCQWFRSNLKCDTGVIKYWTSELCGGFRD